MSKKKKKKVERGCGVNIVLPTEPLAGAAKNNVIVFVLVQDEGDNLFDYDCKLGSAIQFRVGGTVKAYMERNEKVPVPDSSIYIDTEADNADIVTIEFDHALDGHKSVNLLPGQRFNVNLVVARHWTITSPNWE